MPKSINAWGEIVADEDQEGDPYWVPEDQRLDVDEDDPDSNALGEDEDGVDTGDDLDGWKPGDPV